MIFSECQVVFLIRKYLLGACFLHLIITMAKEFKELQAPMDEILEKYGVKFRNNTHELIMDSCFSCGRSKKLYVSKDKGTFICFRCGVKGPPLELMKQYCNLDTKEALKALYGETKFKVGLSSLDDEDDEIEVKKEEKKPDNFKLDLTKLVKKNKTTGELPLPDPMDMASEFKILTSEFVEPYNYLLKRGYTPEIIESLKLLVLPYKDFKEAWADLEKKYGKDQKQKISEIARIQGRIVFPLYIDSLVMGFVARDYTGTKEPKVLNSTGNFRSFSVWNYDLARLSEDLVVCEGTTSAVKCGINRSIALLGKMASPGQIRLIRQMKAKKIFLCLDIGTEDEQSKIYKALAVYYPGRIFKIEVPPVIEVKNKVVDDVILEKVKTIFNVELFLDKDTNLLHFPYEGKGSIFSQARVNPKLPSDQKRTQLSAFLEDQGLKDLEETLFWLLFDSEYKDSGDYSIEEMEQFKQLARPFIGGPLID